MLLESRPIEEIDLVLFVCLQYGRTQSLVFHIVTVHSSPFQDTLHYSAADPKSSDRCLEYVPMITVGYIRRAMQQSVGKCYC